MASDNTILNAGSGGNTIRTLADSGGVEWPAAVLCYATTVSPGGNVLDVVTPSSPLPVSISGTVPISGSVTVVDSVALLVSAEQAGTWDVAISGVAAVSQSGAWNVGLTGPVPAGTNLIGQVAAGTQLGQVFSGSAAQATATAPINVSASGNTTVIPGVAGKRIYVLRWSLRAAGPVSIQWQDTASNALSGPRPLVAYAGDGGSWCPGSIYTTAAGAGLVLNLSSAVAVGGELTYVQF